MVCMGMLSSVRGVVRCRLGVAVDGPVGQYRPRVWVCLVDLTVPVCAASGSGAAAGIAGGLYAASWPVQS